MREVFIPDEFVDLCTDWYSGQDDLMYAVSSVGNLGLGNIRPTDDIPLTDEQWQIHLFECLESDVRAAYKVAKMDSPDAYTFERFLNWLESIIQSLKVEYGVTE